MEKDFRTTRWSVVMAAADSDEGAAEALAWLCETYWYPLYAYIRRRGHDPEQARDLTQSYFVALLEQRFLRHVDPKLGRFRAFLLATLKNFLSKERERERALKRRADDPAFRITFDRAEELYRQEAGGELDPETLFERRWALTLLERALARLAAEHETAGKSEIYRRLKGYLTGESDLSYARIADELSMSEGAVKVAVHRMRQRLGALLREEVAHTVARPQDVGDEVRYLLRVAGG